MIGSDHGDTGKTRNQGSHLNPKNSRRDWLLLWCLRVCATVSAGVIIVIGWFVVSEAIPALGDPGIARLFSDESWHPTSSQFNLIPMAVGTLAATVGSLLLTAPLGIGSALFLRFYAPASMAWFYRRVIEVLAGVPSVVYGLWGLTVVVPMIAEVSPLGQGQSLLAGVLILTMMTLPTVTIAADTAIGAVPADQVRAAAALGFRRRAIAWSVVIPAARNGIVSGVLLQVGRALGETMAVLMICGNIVQVPGNVFAPVRTLTANIALEMGYADDRHRSVLFVSGLMLLLMIVGIMLVAQLANSKHEGNRKPG